MAIDIELKTLKQNNTSWPLTFKASNRFPIVANRVFATLENAQKYIDDIAADASAYPGIVLAVVQDDVAKNNGVYYVKSVAMTEGEKGVLVKVGGAETETATNYSAAKELSKTLVVGQLIKVANAEEIEETVEGKVVKNTYQAGFYIVEGSGVISALSTSTGSDDEVGALKTRVTNLETTRVTKSEFESYQGTVNGSLKTKANASDLTTHTSNGNIHVTLDEKGAWNNAESNAKSYADANFVKKEGYVAYSNEEKTKLAGIAEGAQVNVLEGVQVDGVDLSVDGNKKVNIILTDYAKSDDVYSKADADNIFLKSADYTPYDDAALRGLIADAQSAADAAQDGVNVIAADYLKSADKTELEGKITTAQNAAEKVATDFNTAMDSRMTTVEGKVDELKAINHVKLVNDAIDAFASKTSDDKIVNTFAELLDYAATHSSEYADIYGEVQTMKTSKADQDALDALNVIVGKASVEGGESGSGLVKRVENLEAIDHDAYESADATLKAELQGEISKKADITALNNEVSAREALADIVGTRAEGDSATVFDKLAALVAKDAAQDEVIATKAAQSELDALVAIVGKESEENGIFAKLKALASAVDGKLANNASVNNVAFENGAVVIDAGDIALESAIMSDNGEEQYASSTSIHAVLQSLNNRITAAVSGGLTSVAAGSGIEVSSVIGNSQTVSIKVSSAANNAVTLNTDGIYVERLMVDGNDVE